MFPLFATGVVGTGSNFAAGVIDTDGNLPQLSLTLMSNLPPVSLTPVANLPPVLTTPAIPVAKFEMTLMLFSGAKGKMNHERNLKQNIL